MANRAISDYYTIQAHYTRLTGILGRLPNRYWRGGVKFWLYRGIACSTENIYSLGNKSHVGKSVLIAFSSEISYLLVFISKLVM